MNLFKRALSITLMTLLLTSVSAPCKAEDTLFRDIFENALYGGLAGTMISGAFLAFTHKPEDHLRYLTTGAAVGVLAGSAYGVAKYSKAFATVESGNVKFAMPTIIPQFQENGAKGSSLTLKAELIRGKF